MHPECFVLLVSLITYMVRLDCQSYGNVRQPSQISAFGVVVLILTTLNLGSEGRAIRQSRPVTCTLDKTKTFIRKDFVGSSLGTRLKRFFVSLLQSYLRLECLVLKHLVLLWIEQLCGVWVHTLCGKLKCNQKIFFKCILLQFHIAVKCMNIRT